MAEQRSEQQQHQPTPESQLVERRDVEICDHDIDSADSQWEDNMISLEAPFAMSLFFPLFGMVIAFAYTSWAYHTNDEYYDGNVTVPLKFAPKVAWLSPFSTGSNFAYMAGGVGIFAMKVLSGGQHFPSHGYLAGLLLLLLGIGSFVFHQSGDKMLDNDTRENHNGDWQHRSDVIFMFLMFGALAIFALNSWIHACRGKEKESNVLVFFTTLGMVVLSVVSFVSLQVNYSSEFFLVPCGAIALISMWCAMGLLAGRREAHVKSFNEEIFETDPKTIPKEYKAQRVFGKSFWCIGMFKALPQFVTGLIALAIGRFSLNNASDVDRNFVHDWEVGMNMMELGDHYQEVRKQYDYKHGSWHFLTAVVILGVILNIIEGLSGRMHHALWMYRVNKIWKYNMGEIVSAIYTVLISIVLWTTQQINPPSEVWLIVWGFIIFIGLPLSGYSLVLGIAKTTYRKTEQTTARANLEQQKNTRPLWGHVIRNTWV